MSGLKDGGVRNSEGHPAVAPARILAVDDEKTILSILKTVIETAGPVVTAVSNEKDALEAARREAFDLSIVDLQLERSSGIELMKESGSFCLKCR